jgi:hypothetical protein
VLQGVCLLVMIQSCNEVNVYVAAVISLMQCKMFVMNCILCNVKESTAVIVRVRRLYRTAWMY